MVEGIACASAVAGRVLLDAAASLTWGVAGELDDVTGVEDAGGVLELVKRWRSCCPLGRGPVSRSGYRRVSEALCMRFNPQSRRRVRNNDCCVPEEA